MGGWGEGQGGRGVGGFAYVFAVTDRSKIGKCVCLHTSIKNIGQKTPAT